MSQNDVERTLGRLLTDAAFRAAFFREPWRACRQMGLQLAGGELVALLGIPRAALASLGSRLNDPLLFNAGSMAARPLRHIGGRTTFRAADAARMRVQERGAVA